jgi:hypothetical protein
MRDQTGESPALRTPAVGDGEQAGQGQLEARQLAASCVVLMTAQCNGEIEN